MTDSSTERLRHLVRFVAEKCESDDEVPCVDLEHVETATGRLAADVDDLVALPGDRLRFAAGDVLVSKLRPYLAKSWRATTPGAASSELMVLRPSSRLHPRWLAYVVQSAPFVDFTVATAKGVKMPRTSPEEVGDYRLHLPSLEDQARLADFLDRETQRIDEARASISRIRQLVEERQFAAIASEIKTATSESRRLSLIARLGTGHTPDRTKPEYWEDCTIPWVTAADLSSRTEPFEALMETAQHVSELGVANSAAVVHPPGTVMLCRTASVGLVCRIGVPMATTQAFVTWTPRPELDSEYLMFCLISMRQEWDRLKFGSTHDTIYFPDIQSVAIPFCSLDQQRQVVARIHQQLGAVKWLPSKLEVLDDLLIERRRCLITAAVTGQLDVEAMA